MWRRVVRAWGMRSLAIALVMGGVSIANATPGDLDPTYGGAGTGIAITNIGWEAQNSYGSAVVEQQDGKLVVGGTGWNGDTTFALVRYLPNGSLDASFGDRGRVLTHVGSWQALHLTDNVGTGFAPSRDGTLA